jgi:hypothetical protein
MVMVGHAHINFVRGEPIWPGTRAGILRHLLAARTREEMFDTDRIVTRS